MTMDDRRVNLGRALSRRSGLGDYRPCLIEISGSKKPIGVKDREKSPGPLGRHSRKITSLPFISPSTLPIEIMIERDRRGRYLANGVWSTLRTTLGASEAHHEVAVREQSSATSQSTDMLTRPQASGPVFVSHILPKDCWTPWWSHRLSTGSGGSKQYHPMFHPVHQGPL